MKFIKLTERRFNAPTYFNLAHIRSFYKEGEFTIIVFPPLGETIPDKILVKESPEKIIKLIKEAEK